MENWHDISTLRKICFMFFFCDLETFRIFQILDVFTYRYHIIQWTWTTCHLTTLLRLCTKPKKDLQNFPFAGCPFQTPCSLSGYIMKVIWVGVFETNTYKPSPNVSNPPPKLWNLPCESLSLVVYLGTLEFDRENEYSKISNHQKADSETSCKLTWGSSLKRMRFLGYAQVLQWKVPGAVVFFGAQIFMLKIRLRFLWDELSISQSHNIASDLGFLRKSYHIARCCISLFHSGFETCLKYRQLCINDLWKLKLAEVQGSKSTEENIHATKEVVSSGRNTTNQKQHVDSNGRRKDPQKLWG